MEKIILLNYTAGIFVGPRMILLISLTDLKLGNALYLNVSPTRQDLIIILKKLNFWYGALNHKTKRSKLRWTSLSQIHLTIGGG
jgi:hypothetical protein